MLGACGFFWGAHAAVLELHGASACILCTTKYNSGVQPSLHTKGTPCAACTPYGLPTTCSEAP